jgi:hypothetical protein
VSADEGDSRLAGLSSYTNPADAVSRLTR